MSMYRVTFTSLILKAIKPSHDAVHHPYGCNLTPDDLHRLGGVLDRNPHAAMSASMMNSVLATSVMPAATPGSTIAIPNGWQMKRYSFVATAVVTYEFGSDDYILVEGFTESANVQVTPTGEAIIDPTMRFHPNLVKKITMTETQKVTQSGQRVNAQMVNDVQTALCLNSFSNAAYVPERTYKMTPGVIINKVTDDFSSFINVSHQFNDHRGVVLNNHVAPESISIQQPSKIGGTIAAAVGNAMFELNQSGHTLDSVGTLASNMVDGVGDSAANPFFAWVAQCGQGAGDFFTYRDVLNTTPNIRPTILESNNSVVDSEYWTISNDYTVVATIISQVVSSLLYEMSLSYLEFAYDTRIYDTSLPSFTTTQTPGLVVIHNARSVHQGHVVGEEVLNKIRLTLRDTLLSVITERRLDPVSGNWTHTRESSGKVKCAIWDRTIMEFQIDTDKSMIRYEAATFASGLTTAALTTKQDDLDTISSGLKYIVDVITERLEPDAVSAQKPIALTSLPSAANPAAFTFTDLL